jgi:hypothetical protein
MRKERGVMHDDGPFAGQALPANENISGTNSAANHEATSESELGCVFIAAERWLAGKPPFCGKPALPGSPYCRNHAALCRGHAAPERRR